MTGLSSVVLALLCVCRQMVAGAYLDALLACLVPELRRLKHLGSGGRGWEWHTEHLGYIRHVSNIFRVARLLTWQFKTPKTCVKGREITRKTENQVEAMSSFVT